VSIVLPTHNEELIIKKRIDNLLSLDYPRDKLEVVFVDDSTDSTGDIIRDYVKRYPQMRLVRFDERMGYSPCLIAGCRTARGEVVVLAEASSFMNQEVIRRLVSDLRNPSISMVTGNDVLLNKDDKAGRSEALYLKILNFVRTGESNMDSTIFMKGEAAAVKKNVIGDLQALEGCPGTADTGIALLVRKKGGRITYDPRVQFYEYAPSSHGERIRQKVTRGANLIKVIWHFREMFFRRQYGNFGLVTLPITFAMLTFAPVSLLAGFLFLALLTLASAGTYYMVWLIFASLLLLVLLFSRSLLYTILESEYSLLKALYEILVVRKTHDRIERIVSTRSAGSSND
jgi:cellulose synthase/poly-beta-1,6-N-acetylglucosamine synthase-like glycosyltransferase